eukprot:5495423-Prymnesium_polylepis.1
MGPLVTPCDSTCTLVGFSSSWTLNYDLTLTWVLMRWVSLPLNHALDHEKKLRFKVRCWAVRN